MEVKYIAETKEFIVDGQVIKESSLTTEEREKLMKESKEATLLTGARLSESKNLIV